MTKHASHQLRVFSEPPAAGQSSGWQPPVSQSTGQKRAWHVAAPLDTVCRTFSAATGYRLEFVDSGQGSTDSAANLLAPHGSLGHNGPSIWSAAVDPGGDLPPGHFEISSSQTEHDGDRVHSVRELAGLLAELVNQLSETRRAVRATRGELASLAPLAIHCERGIALGKQIESVLQAAVETLKCTAAGMYLLDENTTELQLRGMWGLSQARPASASRPLDGATADLEAMLGHAVVLSDSALFDLWRVPEADFSAAVCVPISSASSVLGTLWIFHTEPREFEDRETNLLEILAGRLAAEIERETLLRQCRPRLQPK